MGDNDKLLKYSIIWSAAERFLSQAVQFIVSIVIARLLSPSDYGLIAMTAIFIGISQAFVESGFSTALIRKQDRSEIDESTVFYFNIIIGFIIYIILWLIAPLIADFYEIPILTSVTRIISLSIIFNSFQIVPRAILTSKADFKTQTFASFPATIISGFIGICMAYLGYGVWALVGQQIVYVFFVSIILWRLTGWHPRLCFSFQALNDLFGFSSKLLISGLIDTIWNNSYTLVIGKIFAARELGLYSRAYSLGYFPSINIANILQRGFFPILCKYQNNDLLLVEKYRSFLRQSVFVVTPLMLGIAALAAPIINILLTAKWIEAAPFLRILCFYFVLKPIVSINNNIYQVKGRSDLFLKLEVYKKIIAVIFLLGSIPFGVYGMCIGSVISEILSMFVNMFMASKIINLKVIKQIADIIPFFAIALLMYLITSIAIVYLPSNSIKLFVGMTVSISSYGIICSIFKIPEFQQLRSLFHIRK